MVYECAIAGGEDICTTIFSGGERDFLREWERRDALWVDLNGFEVFYGSFYIDI